jgi:hypothetical protein
VRKSSFECLDSLLLADAASPLEEADFDDQLWLFLCQRITTPADCATWPEPVGTYFASRLLEWDVANGGFAQAAFNIPEWFDAAAMAYDRLGLPDAAALIRRAIPIVEGERTQRRALKRARATIAKVFQSFRESSLAELDWELDAVGWWATAARVAYARRHRTAFLAIDRPAAV